MFSLEKLHVYERALTSVAALAQLSAQWDKRYAVGDQLLRASESVVFNLAEGARLRRSPQRQHLVDYAIGSGLECAACVDIAHRKELISAAQSFRAKESLCAVVKMLFGLRRSWAGDQFHEPPGEYSVPNTFLFAHERLEAYQFGLLVVDWVHTLPVGAGIFSRWFREIDRGSTSVVLNIAEGNGRRTQRDHRQFLNQAEASLVKVSTYIQLCQRTGEMEVESARRGLALLDRVALLVRGMVEGSELD